MVLVLFYYFFVFQLFFHPVFSFSSSSYHADNSLFEFLNFLPVSTDSTCNLPCWLESLNFTIPPTTVSKDDFNLTINAHCHGMELVQIDSSGFSDSLSFDIRGISSSCSGNYSVIDVKLREIHASGDVDLSIHQTDLGGTIQFTHQRIPTHATLSHCSVSLNIDHIHFHGSISAELIDLFIPLIKPVMESVINHKACPQLESLVSTNVSELLITLNGILTPFLDGPVTYPSLPGKKSSINLSKFPLLNLATFVLNSVAGTSGPLNLNYMANLFTDNTGILSLYNLDQSLQVNISDLGALEIDVYNIEIEGLNTFSNFDLLNPIGPYHLNSILEMDSLNLTIQVGLNISTFDTVINDQPLYVEFNISTSISELFINLTLDLLLNSEFYSLQFNQLEDIYCLASLVDLANFTQIYVNSTTKYLELLPLDNVSLDHQLDEFINNVITVVLVDDFLIEPLFNYILGEYARPYLNEFIFNMTSGNSCPSPRSVENLVPLNKTSSLWTSVSIGAIAVLLIFCLYPIGLKSTPFIAYSSKVNKTSDTTPLMKKSCSAASMSDGQFVHSSNRPTYNSYSSEEEYQEESLSYWKELGLRGRFYLYRYQFQQHILSSLAFSHNVPPLWRIVIPIILLLNIALFLISNTSVGASVYIVLTVGEDQIHMPNTFGFSLKNSIQDMWNAKIYPLSILIALFSGFWPYCKLFLMLVAWILPTSIVSNHRRETLLMVLDAMGKWSLIDTHVLVLMAVAFRFHLADPHTPETQMDVFVAPDWGFHLFLIATIMTLIMSHILLAFHRGAFEKLREMLPPGFFLNSDGEITPSEDFSSDSFTSFESLSSTDSSRLDPNFAIPLMKINASNTSHPLKQSKRGYLILAALVSTLGLVLVGLLVSAFEFEFKGAAGVVLNFVGQPTHTEYSLLKVGTDLPNSNPNPNSAAIRWIQVTFFAVVIVLPLLHLVVSIVLWVVPLKLSHQRFCFHASEVLNAWSTIDVFVVAIIAALVEIEQFAKFIIGDKCDLINSILIKYFKPDLGEYDTCFTVISTLVTGCWVLFTACVIDIIVTGYIISQSRKAIQMRESRAIYRQFLISNSDSSTQ